VIEGSCHCGAVRIEVPAVPDKLTLCNCSICRRVGGLWSYYPAGTVRVSGHPEHTDGYVWGDRTLSTVRCRHCGCVTHWESLPGKESGRVGVNMRMFDPALLAGAQLRRFDGADSWTYVD
jgi:hypothetical protein